MSFLLELMRIGNSIYGMITQLRHFVAIIDAGGVSAAADVLHLSQPALSRSLRALEERLDVRLLERGRGNPTLSEVGRMLLPRARTLLSEQAALLRDVKAVKNRLGTMAYVNCSPAVAVTLLMETISEVARSAPDLRISIRGDNGTNSEWRTEALRSGEIDVAVSIALPLTGEEEFVQEPLIETELRIASISLGDTVRTTNLAELVDRRWILPPRSSSGRAVIENEFSLMGLPMPLNTVEMSDWRVALIVARETSAVVTLPYHPACFRDLAGLQLLPINFRTRPLPLYLIYRRQVADRPAVHAFVTAIKGIVAKSTS